MRGAGSDPRGAGAEEAVVEVKVGGGESAKGQVWEGPGAERCGSEEVLMSVQGYRSAF